MEKFFPILSPLSGSRKVRQTRFFPYFTTLRTDEYYAGERIDRSPKSHTQGIGSN